MTYQRRNNFKIQTGDGIVRRKSLFGLIDHYGLYMGADQVIENHPVHGVRMITLTEFLDGRPLIKVKPFPGGGASRHTAVRQAYKMIGTRYDLFDFNCEHFVNTIHAVGRKSEQMEAATGMFFGLLTIGFLAAISSK